MANLKTDYKDDILDSTQNIRRKFRMITNDDGTYSFEDVTDYLQNGDSFGALDLNSITNAIMSECLKRIDVVDNLESTSTDLALSANMGRELNTQSYKTVSTVLTQNVTASSTPLTIDIPNHTDYKALLIRICGDVSFGGLSLFIPKVLFTADLPFSAISEVDNYSMKVFGKYAVGSVKIQRSQVSGWSNYQIRVYGIN